MKTLLKTLAASLARTFADTLDPPKNRPDPSQRVDALHDELRRVELDIESLTARFDRHEDDRTHLRPFAPSDTLCPTCGEGTLDIVVRRRNAYDGMPSTVSRCSHCAVTSCVSDEYFDAMPKRVPLGSGDAAILETHGDEGDDDTEPA